MAHFAELDDNSYVKRVLVVNNNELLDENGLEQSQKGIDFLVALFGGRWVQTSYNSTFRKCFAGIDYFYDETADVFIPRKPFPSWVFNEVTWRWQAPVTKPTEGYYVWNEEIQNWIQAD
jgi:hypothetical protein